MYKQNTNVSNLWTFLFFSREIEGILRVKTLKDGDKKRQHKT